MTQAQGTGTTTSSRYLHTDPDGYVFDPETGEAYGITHPETGQVEWFNEAPEGVELPKERFKIEAEDAADWVLSLFAGEEAKLATIQARRVALLANLEGMEVSVRNRIKGLLFRFKTDLETFAAGFLAKLGKGRTVKLPHGTIAFRKTQGKHEITDPQAALAYVLEHAPELLEYKPPTIKAVLAAIEADVEANGEQARDRVDFLRSTGPGESVTITTGIGK